MERGLLPLKTVEEGRDFQS